MGACDSIFVPPHGKVMLNGLALGALYYKGLFDKVGVRANVHRIGAYKSAAEPYSRSGMSDAARDNAEWLLDAVWQEFQSAVATDRGIEPNAFEAAVSKGTLQPAEALEARLVDGVRQRDDLRGRFREGGGAERILDVSSYRRLPEGGLHRAPKIAVFHAGGIGPMAGFDVSLGELWVAVQVITSPGSNKEPLIGSQTWSETFSSVTLAGMVTLPSLVTVME